MQIVVKLRLPPGADLPSGGRVTVELRDVTTLDAPSRSLAAVSVPLPSGRAELEEVVFEFELSDDLVASRDVQIYARVGAPTSNPPSIGDLITTQSHPVRAAGVVSVPLRQVRG